MSSNPSNIAKNKMKNKTEKENKNRSDNSMQREPVTEAKLEILLHVPALMQ